MNAISNTLLTLNIVGMNTAKHAAMLGEAHEFIATGILMRWGFGVSVVSVRGGPYDLIIPAYEDFRANPEKIALLRAQVRTMTDSISFKAGIRGGVNRVYISDIKTYKYTEKDNDLIIGVDKSSLDLYLVPTRHIKKWGSSKSKTKLQVYKNNWDVLLQWNDQFLEQLENIVDPRRRQT